MRSKASCLSHWVRGRAGGVNVEDEQLWFSFSLLLAASETEGRANVLSNSLDEIRCGLK